VTPADRDEYRAALALIAAAAERRDHDVTAILGRGWRSSRRAVIAWTLARWTVGTLPRLGYDDPAEAIRQAITESIRAEAEGTP
jgi:hypothetical protein